jgi:hypothetical protein
MQKMRLAVQPLISVFKLPALFIDLHAVGSGQESKCIRMICAPHLRPHLRFWPVYYGHRWCDGDVTTAMREECKLCTPFTRGKPATAFRTAAILELGKLMLPPSDQ